MAGQGFQRREILRILGAAAIASHVPGSLRTSEHLLENFTQRVHQRAS